MKLLLDQDVYAITAKFLINIGHDVTLVSQLGLSTASDEKILEKAHQENSILVTRDRDYGNLVFVRGMGSGVIYLRILPKTINLVHNELAKVLLLYSQEQLTGAFIVIEANGHRFRKPLY